MKNKIIKITSKLDVDIFLQNIKKDYSNKKFFLTFEEYRPFLRNFYKLSEKIKKTENIEDGHNRLIEYLKTEYGDVCSEGDCIINAIIDILETKNYLKVAEYIEKKPNEKKSFCKSLLLSHIHGIILYWMKQNIIEPNSFWAS